MKNILRYSSYVILLIGLFLHGCKKNNKDSDIENSSNLPDSIIFTDVTPDSTITCFDKKYPWQKQQNKDSSYSITIDVDQDNLPDLAINVYEAYKFVSASTPQANYDYGISIQTLRSYDSIFIRRLEPFCPPIAVPFKKDSTIFNGSEFFRGGMISKRGSNYNPCTSNTFLPDTIGTYYGFKLYENGGFDFGWILLSSYNGKSGWILYPCIGAFVDVKEFAINKTKNKPIRAGQKE